MSVAATDTATDSKQSYEIRACNLWRGWRAQIGTDMTDDSEDGPVWKAVIETLCKIPELRPLLEHPGTRFYNNDLDVLTASFTSEELKEIASKFVPGDEQAYPTILIVPQSYHVMKKKGGKDQPRSVRVSIEGEHPFLWLLHKTDFKDKDSYFDQLRYDIEAARNLNEKLGLGQDLVPSAFVNIKYRFFTSDSHENRAHTCLEVLADDLDAYLTSISTKTTAEFQWVIRTNASVETECTLKKITFPTWALSRSRSESYRQDTADIDTGEGIGASSGTAKDEKKMKIREVEGGEEVDAKIPPTDRQLYFQAQTLGTRRPQLTVPKGVATLTPEKQPHENIQKQVVVAEPQKGSKVVAAAAKSKVGKNFRTMLQQFQSKIPIPLRFFPKRQGTTDGGDVSSGILYFALSIVAVVVIGLIVTTAIVTTQKKKKSVLQLQQQQQPQSQPLTTTIPTMTSVAEEEVDFVKDPYRIDAVRAAERKQYRNIDDADEERSRIDSLITKENKHYPSAQRIQYKAPRAATPSSFSRSLAQQDELEKTLGFPLSRSRASGAMPSFGKTLYSAPVQTPEGPVPTRGILRTSKPNVNASTPSNCERDTCSFGFR